MNGKVRGGLSLLAVAFTGYLAVGAFLWTDPVRAPVLFSSAVGLFLLCVWLCVFWGAVPVREARPADAVDPAQEDVRDARTRLPRWACVLVLAAAAIVPSASWAAVDVGSRLEPFATWSLGGIGALMTIVMVRRRPVAAWVGIGLLAIGSSLWIGVGNALAYGLVGAVVWVVVAQLLTGLVDRAAADTAELTELERRSSEWLAGQEGRRRERRIRVQQALAIAGPVLIRTIETDGELSAEERESARLAEGALRDELRGPRLLDDAVRARLREARGRGSMVTVLDEGGLDDASEGQVARVRAELADALVGAASDRIYIRTSPNVRAAVTVVGRSTEGGADEETVDLWREIPLPTD